MSTRTQRLIIDRELPDLNNYIRVERGNKFSANKLKGEWTLICKSKAMRQLSPIDHPVKIKFFWVTPDKRKDPDNLAFAKKFILDGLVDAGILANDGRKQIISFTDDFGVDPDKPRVEVYLEPAA